AAIRKAAREHAVEHLAIAIHTLHLVVRALVVVEAEPRHRVDDRLRGFRRGALHVVILDAQDEHAAMMARERPWEERRAYVAEMQEAGRARSKARANHSDIRDQRTGVGRIG